MSTIVPVTPPPIALFPYLLEIRDTCEDALARFAELEEAAKRWLELYERGQAGGWRNPDPAAVEQSDLHRSLEAFLAAFARISLLLKPRPRNPDWRRFATARGKCLCYVLGVESDDPIHNVALRNAWMHFDERMDVAGPGVTTFLRQWWGHSRDTTPDVRANALRHLEVDTLRVFYRDQDNVVCEVELRPLRDSVERLYTQVVRESPHIRTRLQDPKGPCPQS